MLNLNFLVLTCNLLFSSFKSRVCSDLVFILQSYFLHLTTKFHVICVRCYMCFLLFFITIDPNLSCVFFCSNLLTLLHNFVQKLLSLNIILFFECFLSDLKRIRFSFTFSQFLLLILKLPPIVYHQQFFLD